jgi:hypothetical protein
MKLILHAGFTLFAELGQRQLLAYGQFRTSPEGVMKILRRTMITCGVILVCAGGVRADSQWQTVTVGGFTMDVPAVIGGDYSDNGMMYFSETDGDSADMTCFLIKKQYTRALSRETVVNALADGGQTLCNNNDSTVSNWELRDAKPVTVDGQPAATCSAAYNDSSKKHPGQVVANMTIAGAANLYQLECITGNTEKQVANYAYIMDWEGDVTHIQNSLRLPASEK